MSKFTASLNLAPALLAAHCAQPRFVGLSRPYTVAISSFTRPKFALINTADSFITASKKCSNALERST
jgi:hypothetical protein